MGLRRRSRQITLDGKILHSYRRNQQRYENYLRSRNGGQLLSAIFFIGYSIGSDTRHSMIAGGTLLAAL